MINKMCQHHWLIEEAHGPTSKGRCINCGEEREFPNWCDLVEFRAWRPKEERETQEWEAKMDIMTHHENDLMKQRGAWKVGIGR